MSDKPLSKPLSATAADKAQAGAGKVSGLLPEHGFHRSLRLEKMRSQRSGNPFLLALLDISGTLSGDKNGKIVETIIGALGQATRETDLTGWYKQHSVVGIMFTELGPTLTKPVLATLLLRVSGALRERLTLQQFSQIYISFRIVSHNQHPASLPMQEPFRSLDRFAI